MKNILFLCTGNSCRSQMAQGYGRSIWGDKYNFYSAGIIKHGLNPLAVRVMAEDGVDISSHSSNTVDEVPMKTIDLIITVCSHAHETCPYVANIKTLHQGFDDPPSLSKGLNDDEQILSIYRKVRKQIKEFILNIEEYIE